MALGSKPQQHTRALSETYFERESASIATKTNLEALLSNSLVLYEIIPYLPISALLSLASTNRAYRSYLLSHIPGVFRHLDLTQVKRASATTSRQIANEQLFTEDAILSAPLRAIFGNLHTKNLLQDVQTLVLDGLASVTAELCHDIIINPAGEFNVRILSVRECRNLNENKLQQVLRYACRPSHPEGSLRLEGLYVFGKKDQSGAPGNSSSTTTTKSKPNRTITTDGHGINVHSHGHDHSPGSDGSGAAAAENWYTRPGLILAPAKPIPQSWAETLAFCSSSIAFDAPLCTSPRHLNSRAYASPFLSVCPTTGVPGGAHRATAMPPYAVATYSLSGCATCGVAPEGFSSHGGRRQVRGEGLPMIAPVASHASSARAACRPPPPSNLPSAANNKKDGCSSKGKGKGRKKGGGKKAGEYFVPRCLECIKERYCSSCDQWWCESCYEVPGQDDVVAAAAMHSAPTPPPSSPQVQIVTGSAENSDDEDGLMAHELAAQQEPPKPPGVKTRKIIRGCWDCELSCETCIADTQRRCQACGGGYCIIHYEGSTHTFCDWCSSRSGRRHRGDMY